MQPGKKESRFSSKCRIIRVDRNAVQEIINEFFMEHIEKLFDVSETTEQILETRWNPNDDSFTAVLFQCSKDGKSFVTDLEKIEQMLDFTSTSIYNRPAYQERNLEEFLNNN